MTNKNHPNVDIVITCFNEGRYVEEAVHSVLQQTCADRVDRIVIADDGSETETVSILKRIEADQPKVSVIFGPGGAGPADQHAGLLPGERGLALRVPDHAAVLDGCRGRDGSASRHRGHAHRLPHGDRLARGRG